ncbi:hypothetical protein [Kitasatospora sp. NPDC096140]|uniref:hypothetical protein n=1 Tax=Kitasatospora sp. NPDC096140 TaxID=3155425 RepID=UPI00332BA9AD
MTELIDMPDAEDGWEPASSTRPDRRNPAWQSSMFQNATWPLSALALLSVDLDAVARRLRLTLETSWDGHGQLRAAFFVLDGTDFVVTHHEDDAPGTHVWTRKGGPTGSAERVARLLAALGVGPEAVSYSTWGAGTDLSRVPDAWWRGRTKPMSSRQEFWDGFKKRPGMYVGRVSFGTVTAFLTGYDFAAGGVLLDGFRDWLAGRLGSGWNVVYPALVVDVAFPDGRPAEPWSEEEDQHAVRELFRLLDEFFEHLAGTALAGPGPAE